MSTKQETSEERPSAGVLPSAVERQRRSEFMVACASGDLPKVEQMLAEGADPNQVSDLGGTPLTWAVVWGHEDVVECLLSNGADVELPARPAWSPLMHAASRGDRSMVSMLIAYGADPLREEQNGRLPADMAVDSGHEQCAFLIELLARLGESPIRCGSRSTRGRRRGPAVARSRRRSVRLPWRLSS